jgi:hypothetical protein
VKLPDNHNQYVPALQALLIIVLLTCWSLASAQNLFSYKDIAKRYSGSQLSFATVEEAKMQGECLVGLKNLNFRKRDEFDPVAEWTNYRSLSLLEQFPPCNVLIMMEVARAELVEEESEQ